MIHNDRGQTLISKYVWVIETIYREGRITFDELNDKWKNDEISRGEKLSKRTFDNWRSAIQDVFGVIIANENCGQYCYFIENPEDLSKNGLRSWLFNTLCVSNLLTDSQCVKDRILLEYVPSGQVYLKPIIDAMKENRVLTITYYNYWRDDENTFDVQPYCVKLFRQRWYMVACGTHPQYAERGPRTYALDRIMDLRPTSQKFKMPEKWSADEYFLGSYGIIANPTKPLQQVKLKVAAGQANYIRDLKLHESQEEIERNGEYSIFTLKIHPEFDFIQEILRNGEDVEVLEPLSLRREVTEKIERLWKKYK